MCFKMCFIASPRRNSWLTLRGLSHGGFGKLEKWNSRDALDLPKHPVTVANYYVGGGFR